MADAGIIYVYKDWDTVIPEKIGTIYVVERVRKLFPLNMMIPGLKM